MSKGTSHGSIKNSPHVFYDEVKKIKIVSDHRRVDPPLPGNEVEQRLTITADGRVLFSSFSFNDGKLVKRRERRFKTDMVFAEAVLSDIGNIFRDEFFAAFSPDKGGWKLFITNTDNDVFTFSGCLCALNHDLVFLSSLMREDLNMPELLAFDGLAREDRIEKVTIDYQRITKREPGKLTVDSAGDYITASRDEQIILDRSSQTLAYFQKIGSLGRISRTYQLNFVISEFLNKHYSTDLFPSPEDNPPDLFPSPQGDPPDDFSDSKESKKYSITVEYLYGKPRIISGTFNKNGLPEDFPVWAEDIRDLMDYCGRGEIIRPSIYGKAKRRSGDYIFCSVVFGSGRSYYYRTDDDTLQVGDSVIVPVRSEGETTVAEIEQIEYFSEADVPMPIDRVKFIIRRSTDENINEREEDERSVQSIDKDSDVRIIEKEPKQEDPVPAFDTLVLCNEKKPNVQVYVKATLSEGCLKISGQDLGEAPQSVFGEDEYEYFYDFDLENTKRLFTLLAPEQKDITKALVREFSGMDGCRKLRDFCDANRIKYSFFTC
jgi:hypothetical protein